MKKKIGYIDEDEGQLSNFHHTLKAHFDIKIFKISASTTVELLVDEVFIERLDMLVIDFRLTERGGTFNADSVVHEIRGRNPHYPLIILTSHEDDALDNDIDATLVNSKDVLSEGERLPVFIHKLNKISEAYHRKVHDCTEALRNLELEKGKRLLSASDEDRYIDLCVFVDETKGSGRRVSRSFYSEGTNQRLDNLIKKTEDLLNKLSS